MWGLHVQGPFLAGYTPVESPPLSYGIKRLDHAVGNVPKLRETLKYIADATGFHEFAEFSAEVCIQLSEAVTPRHMPAYMYWLTMDDHILTIGTSRS